jgi:hypothetical protein
MHSEKSLAHDQTKDLSIVVWVANMKLFWIVSISVCIWARVQLAALALYHQVVRQLL